MLKHVIYQCGSDEKKHKGKLSSLDFKISEKYDILLFYKLMYNLGLKIEQIAFYELLTLGFSSLMAIKPYNYALNK